LEACDRENPVFPKWERPLALPTLMDKDLKKTIKDLGFFSTVGMAMAFSIALGALIGHYLDKWLDTKPWLFFIFFGFGIAAAFSNLYKLYKKADKF
jgi:F0F1-type ATP synthase assembly protein I